MSGGYYCTNCGACFSSPGWGTINCGQCGHLGLRGFNKRPKRIGCTHEGCTWKGWNDGGVNDDLGRHLRRDHPAGASSSTDGDT